MSGHKFGCTARMGVVPGEYDCDCGSDRERELLGQVAALREALVDVRGRLCNVENRVERITEVINEALASTSHAASDFEARVRAEERERIYLGIVRTMTPGRYCTMHDALEAIRSLGPKPDKEGA